MQIKLFEIGRPFITNCYLVYDENTKDAVIVDPAAPSETLRNFIQQNGLNLHYLILTHGHGDHTGGIDYFKAEFPGVKLVASGLERKFLYDRDASEGKGGIVADIELKDEDHMQIGGMDLRFISTPGHTPGGMCILIENTLISGDTLFHCSVGRTDLPGGNTLALMTSIREKLLPLPDDTIVLPGHDMATTIGYERKYNPWL